MRWRVFPGSSDMSMLSLAAAIVWSGDGPVAATTNVAVAWKWRCSLWLSMPPTNTFDRSYQRYQEVTFDESYYTTILMKQEVRDVYIHHEMMCSSVNRFVRQSVYFTSVRRRTTETILIDKVECHTIIVVIVWVVHTYTTITIMAALTKSQKKKWYNYAMFKNNLGKPLWLDAGKCTVVLQKALAVNSQPTEQTFPELPHVIIWMRFVIAVVYGTVLGIRNVRGSIMILNTVNLITFIPYMYCRFYLNVTMDSYSHQPLFYVGLLPAVALALLIWIYFFTLHHEMEIELLAKFILSNATTTSISNLTMLSSLSSSSDDPHVMHVTGVPPLTEDSEF